MTVEELAQRVIEMLDGQQAYFRGGRSSESLQASKKLESELRKDCKAILSPPAPPKPTLFANG